MSKNGLIRHVTKRLARENFGGKANAMETVKELIQGINELIDCYIDGLIGKVNVAIGKVKAIEGEEARGSQTYQEDVG